MAVGDLAQPEHPARILQAGRLGQLGLAAWEQIRPGRGATEAERDQFRAWRARQVGRITGWQVWQGWLREHGVSAEPDLTRGSFDAWFMEARYHEWDLLDAWMAAKQFAAWAGW
jgi:hypothetical protein